MNTMTVSTQEIIEVEVFDLVSEDNADILFNQSEQSGLNSVKLSSIGDVTIVTGDLDTTNTSATTKISTTINEKTTTISVDQLTDTYFLSGNYDSTTGLFTTTVDGDGADTLVYGGNNADVLTDNANAVILVGVDSVGLTADSLV